MYLQIALDRELLGATVTPKGFLLGVNPLVLEELGGIAEGLDAEGAAEGLPEPRLCRVVPVDEVDPQVTARLERLRAQVANKLPTLKISTVGCYFFIFIITDDSSNIWLQIKGTVSPT